MSPQDSVSAVAQAERDAVELFTAHNPGSRDMFLAAQPHMPGGNTRTALYYDPFPLYIARSEGAYVTDADGHSYLDALGEFTAGLYGHSNPVIRHAVSEALETGFSNGGPGGAEAELAALICNRFPSVEKVRFCNTGTEANLYALTLAKIATGRSKVLVFEGAYHGGVLVFANGGSPMNVPFDWLVATYNDENVTRKLIRDAGSSLAAVIIEPMMSNGGCIPADSGFLKMLRAECDAAGALLVFDEVVTSRMGPGGMQQRLNVLPDLTTFGKYLGAGFSFGAFGGRADLLDLMDPSRPNALPHAGTYNNNVFSMHAGAVALRQEFTPERAKQLYEDGERLRRRLNEFCGQVSNAVQFIGCGSTMNIHFRSGTIRSPADLKGENPVLKKLFHLDLLELGVYAARRGQINLSLPMQQEDFDKIANSVGSFLSRRAELIRAI